MELTNEFRVAVPLDTAWTVLNDVELIAPCLPGAQLQEIEGDEYRGIVKVKVGPITAQYKGAATFLSQEPDAGTVVLHAEGRDTRGQGTAAADITVQLTEDGNETAVEVSTDLKITGKVAQFGRGVLADVSAKLLDEFVECLETKVLADGGPAQAVPVEEAVASAPGGSAAVRSVSAPEPEPVDLLGSARAPMFKRLAPIITAVILILFLGRRRRRRRGSGGS